MKFISNMTKRTRIIAAAMAAVLCLGVVGTIVGVTYVPRSKTLKVLNWEDYMPKSVIKDFQKEVRKKTGERFRVSYHTADTNESMYTLIKTKKADYDLICVSEYMMERMYAEELLLELDFNKKDDQGQPVYTFTNYTNIDPVISQMQEKVLADQDALNPTKLDSDGKIFTIPYLYGTNGIMFNPKKLGGDDKLAQIRNDANYWSTLWNKKPDGTATTIDYSGKISMKNVARDSFVTALLYRMEQGDGSLSVAEIMGGVASETNKYSATTITNAETALKAQKPIVDRYEVDNGKVRMANKSTNRYPAIGMYWSCDAGYVWNELNNKDIEYYVPESGSNVWIDGWVMPKYSKAKTSARIEKYALWFLDYLSSATVAQKNMEYAGSCTPVIDARTNYYDELFAMPTKNDTATEADKKKSFFKDKDQAWKDMYLAAMFPGQVEESPGVTVLDRCELFRYLGGTADENIGKMWNAVRK